MILFIFDLYMYKNNIIVWLFRVICQDPLTMVLPVFLVITNLHWTPQTICPNWTLYYRTWAVLVTMATNMNNNEVRNRILTVLLDYYSFKYYPVVNFPETNDTNGFHHSQPNSKYNTYNSYASLEENRPSVDSLLNEMDNASLYAVPNGWGS